VHHCRYDIEEFIQYSQKDNIICTEASKIAYPAFAYCTFDITSDDETANITARII
jgi:hypothetical protein